MITKRLALAPSKTTLNANTAVQLFADSNFSAKQRMSVVCRNEFDNRIRVFVKGSPEMISSLCKPQTLPVNFKTVLEQYTKEGYRVIALS